VPVSAAVIEKLTDVTVQFEVNRRMSVFVLALPLRITIIEGEDTTPAYTNVL
jgi:hypothetical protein